MGSTAGGALGGDIACEQGHRGEHDGGSGDAERIVGDDAVELGAHQACHRERHGNRDHYAGDREQRDFPQHQCEQARASGAEREADADFAGAPRYGIGHHAIEADGGQQGGQNAKESREPGHGALRGERLIDLIFHGAEVGDGKAGIQAVYSRRSDAKTVLGSPAVRA